ncbi:MAG: IgA Peptidase M64 [Odoribacteraceae bacterium]|jgi:hypothetical protein|nr:IgA Peptidase M64 [Odoribacteraceae bacterium]
MKRVFLMIACALPLLLGAQTVQPQFNDWFELKTLRMDFIHAGDRAGEELFFDELIEEPFWGGSVVNLIDTTLYGNYYVTLRDLATGTPIYSRGFCTLFREWRDSEEATRVRKAATGSVIVPYPKKDALIEISLRNRRGEFEKKLEHAVRVEDYFIKKERRRVYPTREILSSGSPARSVDIVLLPDGYTAEEMEKFLADSREFTRGLFSFSPYREHQQAFNVRAVLAPSEESGTDNPAAGVWKSTLLSASFYTLNSERYLMTYDHKTLRDLAANVPYDLIYVIVNTSKYGGGAIYNHYGISVSGNLLSAKVYVHEFGHLFLGLGDEYAEDATYNDMYPPDVEPWEANITTLVDFARKWQDLVEKDTPVPTPLDPARPERIGVYEGAGYVNKGIYRPRQDCLMRTLKGDDFCPVCTRAIVKQIHFCTE